MKMIHIYIILIVFVVQSCYLIRQKPEADLEKIGYRALLQHNVEWQNSIKTLNGGTRITLDSPNYSGKFDAKILMGGEDSLLITVTGPFGMRLGKVFISQNRFLFYNQLMNQFYTGSKHDFQGRNFLQFPMEISQVRNVFIAQDKFDVLKMETYEIRDNQYFLKAVNGNLAYNIWFDPQHMLINKIEYYQNGLLIFYKEYRNFRKVNNTIFPHLINFVRPDNSEGLSIYFTSLNLNRPLEKEAFNIKISDTADQIDLSIQNN
jgi:hypothetical protein